MGFKMLRKKEKKAVASIFMLLIGWPIGLDQFFEGKTRDGVLTLIGWLIVLIAFLISFSSPAANGLILIPLLAIPVGLFCITKKLVAKTRAFVEADD